MNLRQVFLSVLVLGLSLTCAQTGRPVLTGLDNLLENRSSTLSGKRIGIVTNQTGVDRTGIPIWEKIDATALFSPEHGLFGEVSDGEAVSYDGRRGGMPRIHSLYGKTRKPTAEMLEDIDLVLYDIMDIGVRTYTFISTMGLVMEAAGEADIPVWILDRPNPITGAHVGGPSLHPEYRSFVGYYPIPLQYGLTPGELAQMIVGEGWIEFKPDLEVIPLVSWSRDKWYDETGLSWVPPSPNIPDLETAIVYPGLVLVEATNVSEGRGTDHPFLWVGAPWIDGELLSREMNTLHLPGVSFQAVEFTPRHMPGIATHPKYEGFRCQGIETKVTDRDSFGSVKTGLALLVTLNRLYPLKFEVRKKRMNRLAGTDLVIRALQNGWSVSEIYSRYAQDIETFRAVSKRYLIY
ncbi:MAG: exo-beta-N-acetylmuramidase NamZ domain-containing protein [Fidelibacterota bacterium]